MSPRSPSLAFDPTPALAHSNFSLYDGHLEEMNSLNNYCHNNREVHFDMPVKQGRHSIATSNVPLLPAISSASHLPKQAFRVANPNQNIDITAYFEQCRNVNEQLRQTHEQERKAWQIERTALQTRIADLEYKLNKFSAGRRRLSNDSPQVMFNLLSHRPHGHTISNAPLDHLKQEGKPAWLPESPTPATRVFAHDDDIQHLPSISEDNLHMLSRETSQENKPIPIQEIDGTLDGITVKSEGVKSSFVRIMSPIMTISPGRSPSPKQLLPDVPQMRLDHSSLLDPLDAKLRKNAGHTPLAFDGTLSSTQSTGDPTPREERPPAPAPSTRPPLRPSERSDSYFSTTDLHEAIIEEEEPEEQPQFEPEDDKPLTGQLMLDASGKSQASHTFLDQLDHKLEEEVRKSMSNTPQKSPEVEESTKTDDEPRLRLKKSTNFGSAFGIDRPGKW